MPVLSLIKRSLWLSGALFVLKIVAALMTNSLGVLASAADSLMDICSSAVNYVSCLIAGSPADAQYPYGRLKAEALAGLFQGAFIGAGAALLVIESARRFFYGSQMEVGFGSAGVMAVSIIASAWHGFHLRRVASSSRSLILRAESLHFIADVFANGGVLAALAAAYFTRNFLWDLGIGAMVAFYILRDSGKIMAASIAELLDRGVAPQTQKEIEILIREHHPAVIGFHDLRTRKAGSKCFIDFHVELRDSLTFREAHNLVESLIDKIKTRIPGADVTAHYDPEGEP